MLTQQNQEAQLLSYEWSGHFLSELEKVAIAAVALCTVNSEAISDLTGVKKLKVKCCVSILEQTGWDIQAALETQFDDLSGNHVRNREVYNILNNKGIIA